MSDTTFLRHGFTRVPYHLGDSANSCKNKIRTYDVIVSTATENLLDSREYLTQCFFVLYH